MKEGMNELVSIVSATGEEKVHYQAKSKVSQCVKGYKNERIVDWLID